jgi:hypothetical protein
MSLRTQEGDQIINLQDLMMRFRDAGRAAEAAHIMDGARKGGNKPDLSVLLRDHRGRHITSAREIRQRDSFDYLLAFYSILEIASLIGFVPDPIPQAAAKQFLRDLKTPAVRRYYEKHYVLLLPRLTRLRLEGKSSLAEAHSNVQTYGLFQSFLSFESQARDDEDVEMFLWFLDDGYSDGYGLVDALKCLRNRNRFVKRMLRPRGKQDDLDKGLRGFGKVIAYCVDFDELLQRCQGWPLFQSALWHYYAYWFDLLNESVGSSLHAAISNINSWAPSQTREANRLMHQYMQRVTASVDRLLSGDYGRQLRTCAAPRGRLHILDKMYEAQPKANANISQYAPRIYTLHIPTDKIRDVIGPGGKVIRGIIERTGVKIDVEDDGTIHVASADEASANKAIQIIVDLTASAEVGKTYLGKVVRLVDFGAYVEIFPGTDGLLHISEIAENRIREVRDELKEGDQILVKVLALEGNKIKLSRRAVLREQREKLAEVKAQE